MRTARPRRRVVVLKTGDAALAIRQRVGDYDRWFGPALAAAGVAFDVVPAHLGARMRLERCDGVVITGSPLSLVTPLPWMIRLAEDVRRVSERGTPVLGVCFGHQLLALAYGVPVVRSPLGREIGTVEVQLTAAGKSDRLFAGCPSRFAVQATHEDAPAALPATGVALAVNDHGLQAMALGPHVRGVQFHPELSPEGMAAVVEARAKALDREGRERGLRAGERVGQLLAGIRHVPFARKLLENFLVGWV
jgi:GMP synthase (glutamine-hydrolysing)